MEGLEEVCGGEVCCFVCVGLYVSTAWVGDIDVNLPEVGGVLKESAGDKGIVFSDDIESIQGP